MFHMAISANIVPLALQVFYWAEPSKTCSMNLTVMRHLHIVQAIDHGQLELELLW